MFNDAPPAGWRDVNIPITAVYKGSGRTSFDASEHLMVLGSGTNVEYSTFEGETCGVIPKDITYDDRNVRKGGKIAGNICFRVPKEDISSLKLLWSDDAYGLDGVFTTLKLR